MDIPPDQLTYRAWSITIVTVSSHTSIYLIVVMTFERFYSILRPYKAASFNTVKRAKITISCITLVNIVYSLPHLFITSVSGQTCVHFLKGMKYLSGRIYFFVDQLVGLGIPFISLLVMNCVIISNLRKRPKFLTNKSNSLGEGQDQDQCQSQSQGHRNTRHPRKTDHYDVTRCDIFVFNFDDTSLFHVVLHSIIRFQKLSKTVCRVSFILCNRDRMLSYQFWY